MGKSDIEKLQNINQPEEITNEWLDKLIHSARVEVKVLPKNSRAPLSLPARVSIYIKNHSLELGCADIPRRLRVLYLAIRRIAEMNNSTKRIAEVGDSSPTRTTNLQVSLF